MVHVHGGDRARELLHAVRTGLRALSVRPNLCVGSMSPAVAEPGRNDRVPSQKDPHRPADKRKNLDWDATGRAT